jgi:hypothetical protein
MSQTDLFRGRGPLRDINPDPLRPDPEEEIPRPASFAEQLGPHLSVAFGNAEEEDPEEALSYRIMVARAALTKAAESAAKFKRPEIERSLRALANAVPRLEDQV